MLVHVLVGQWSHVQYDLCVAEPKCTWNSDEDKNDCGPHTLVVTVYFFSYIVGATYIFLNLFVAVVLEVAQFMLNGK